VVVSSEGWIAVFLESFVFLALDTQRLVFCSTLILDIPDGMGW
jgi:hypothetical protein